MRMRLLFGCAIVVLIACMGALAQDTGYITGTVTDANGAVVPNAQVTVANTARGITRTLNTNSDGEYVAAALPAGTYTVTVDAKGFEKSTVKDVVLQATQKIRIDPKLKVGAQATEVTVTADAARVETQSSEVAGTVGGAQISQLSLNGRNFTQLATLVPGVSNQTGSDEGQVGIYGNVSFSVNGGRTEYNNWEVDGGDNMDNGSNNTLNVYPSIDSIGEFRVLTSSYGAQYGRNGSGTVEIVTKSGTNQFHGNAYYFGRNEFFNARNYFDTVKPEYRKHDYGYTLGGPIFIPNVYNENKQKTFFFWSEEWRRQSDPTTFAPLNVPSDAQRAGDFSELCPFNAPDGSTDNSDCPIDPATGNPFPGNIVPIDPNAQALLALIPKANTTAGGYAAWQGAVSEPTRWREELIKVDHNFSEKHRATFRFIHDSWNTVTPTTLWSTGDFPTIQTKFLGPGVSIVQKLTSAFTPTLLNEFTFSYTTDHINLTNIGPWQRPPSMTMTGLFANGFGGKVPGIQISGGNAYGGGFGEDAGFIPWTNSNPTYTYRDNITKNLGKHTFQFGFYYVAGQKNEENSPDIQGFLTFDNTSGVTTGNAFADLLTGNIAEFSQTNKQIKYYNRYKILEPYFQDDWRVTPKLTLNLGLRLSLYGTYRERYKQAFNFNTAAYDAATAPTIDPNTGAINGGNPFNGLVQCGGPGQPPGCMKGHLFNPAPRIGFAWDPTGSGKTAIRGGYGVFFEHTNGNESNSESLEGTPPLVQTPNQFNVVGYTNIGGAGLTFPLAVVSIPNQVTWPYMQQWHLDVQRQLPAGIVGMIAYVGSKGTHLTDIRNLNQLQSLTAAQNPYAPGQPIVQNDCDTMTVNGVAVSGPAATNLAIACGADPNPLRTMFPGFSDITRIENAASSNYHSLQVSARRNTGPVILSLAYTYSHSIDDSSDRFDTNFVDSYNLARSRANSNFDERHNLQISYVYDLPFFRGNSLRDRLLGGWQTTGLISAQSGTPFTIVNGTDFGDNAGVGNGVGTGSYPDVVGDPGNLPSQKFYGDIVGPLLYNPAAFAVPTGLTFGNAGRNMLTLPFHTNVDMALFKHFKIDESRNVEFRWEVFNVFNHTQFNSIDNTFTGVDFNGSTFLHPLGAHNPRIMQLGVKFSF